MERGPKHRAPTDETDDSGRYFLDAQRIVTENSQVVDELHTPETMDDFDEALWSHQPRRARLIGRRLIERDEAEGYSPRQFHTQIKQLALPLYERAYLESQKETVQESLRQELAALYGQATELLASLQLLQHSGSLPEFDQLNRDMANLRGNMSELTVFALVARNLYGDDRDLLTILPSKERADHQTSNGELKDGIDFMVFQRHDGVVPLQVKTSAAVSRSEEYDPSILVVHLQQLVGGKKSDINRLQEALVLETLGAQHVDYELIAKTTHNLYDQIATALRKPAN